MRTRTIPTVATILVAGLLALTTETRAADKAAAAAELGRSAVRRVNRSGSR